MGIAFFFFFFSAKMLLIWYMAFCILQLTEFICQFYIKSHIAATEYALLLSCLALYPVALSLLTLLLWVRLHILGRNGCPCHSPDFTGNSF